MKCLVSGDMSVDVRPSIAVSPTVGDEAPEIPSDDAVPCCALLCIELER